MLYPDLIDVPTEVFGGFCPAIPPANLPPGGASAAQDVIFPLGAVRTRGGLLNYFPGQLNAAAKGNGLKTYLTPTLAQRLLIWDSLGNFWKENPQGTLNLINSRPYLNLFYESQTLFGREYQAFFNSLGGYDVPRQFDDTNWDRVSQSGPGAAPEAVDEIAAAAITASPSGLFAFHAPLNVQSGSENGYLVTLTATIVTIAGQNLLKRFLAGDQWLIAGVGAGYDGTYAIATCTLTGGSTITITYVTNVSGLAPVGIAGTVSMPYYDVVSTTAVNPSVGASVTIAGAGVATYNATWVVRYVGLAGYFGVIIPGQFAIAASGNGTWTQVGNVVAGLHGVSVAFVTRQGLITQAAPPFFWTAAGSKRASLAQIAIGPPNVIARLLLFTPVITAPAVTGTLYSLPTGSPQVGTSAMLIPDNVTTQTAVDFTDVILIAGFQAEYLFNQIELGEMSCFLSYNARTVWLGERARQSNFNNMSFDGGFNGNVPDGWTQDYANHAGGSSAVAGALWADWGDAYVITGDGATAVRGKIAQSAYQDYLKVPIIAQNVSYGVRVRVAGTGGLAQGTLHINLQSTLGAFTTAGLSVTAAQATAGAGKFIEFTANLTDVPLATPPADMVIQVYADGTPTVGGKFIVDSIEPYQINTPFNYSTARFSHTFNPESFDSVTGQVQVRQGDGQKLTAGFPLRNNLYLAKDHYLCYVTDDGINEPASWAVNEVSATVGICGPNAVDWTEEWAVFAERAGLYICWGADPVKLTPEIQTDASGTGKITWASIDWTLDHTVWVRIDKVNKRILVGVPLIGEGRTTFMLDYAWLEGAQETAASPMVTYSAFTGKMLAHGKGRRWAVWNIQANSMCFAERTDGTAQPFFGNSVGNGKIYEQLDCSIQSSDDGVAINSYWAGAGNPSAIEEQQYQLGAHRKLCGYMKGRTVGVGKLNISVTTAMRTTSLRYYTLSLTPGGDWGRPLNIHGERFYPQIGTNAVGSWFQCEKLCLCMKKDAAILVSGLTS
jgi:hypothetical protein